MKTQTLAVFDLLCSGLVDCEDKMTEAECLELLEEVQAWVAVRRGKLLREIQARDE